MWTQLTPKKAQPCQFSAYVYCGQPAVCIRIPLGTEVGFSLGNIVLDGDLAPPPLQGHSPPIFGQCLLWPDGWMDQDATWYRGRPQPRRLCVWWGPSSARKKCTAPTQFLAYVCCGQATGWIRMPLGT